MAVRIKSRRKESFAWFDLRKYEASRNFDLLDWAQQLSARHRLRAGEGALLHERLEKLKSDPLELVGLLPVFYTGRPIRDTTHVDIDRQKALYSWPEIGRLVADWDERHAGQDRNSRLLSALMGPGPRRWDSETEARFISRSGKQLKVKLKEYGNKLLASLILSLMQKNGDSREDGQFDLEISDREMEDLILGLAGKHPDAHENEIGEARFKEYLQSSRAMRLLKKVNLYDNRIQSDLDKFRGAARKLFDGLRPKRYVVQPDGIAVQNEILKMLETPFSKEEQSSAHLLTSVASTPCLRVDLNYSDEILVDAFRRWLDSNRSVFKHAGISALSKPKGGRDNGSRRPVLKFTTSTQSRWHSYRILPYLDLIITSEIEGRPRPTASEITDLIFPDCRDDTKARVVEKELPSLAKLLMARDSIDRLLLEGQALRAGIRK